MVARRFAEGLDELAGHDVRRWRELGALTAPISADVGGWWSRTAAALRLWLGSGGGEPTLRPCRCVAARFDPDPFRPDPGSRHVSSPSSGSRS